MATSLNLVKVKPLVAGSSLKVEINDKINTEEIIKAFQSTEKSFKRTRTIICPPSPIPAERCVPTMASIEQVQEYESKFVNVLNGYLGNLTICDLLRVFSFSDKEIPIGKLSFLGSFFQKIKDLNINLDVAILCNDTVSEKHLVSILKAINLNCNPLTHYGVKRDTYGVIIKIRKAEKPVTAIKTATSVDLVMVYDSAINVYNRVLDQFSGVNHANPQIIYISTSDSADIRCYNSTVHEDLSWNTRYKDVEIAQTIFHQSNRRGARQSFCIWNDFMATEVAEWAAKKDNTPYKFYRPEKKTPAARVYNLWGSNYPLTLSAKKPINLIATAAPQVTNISLQPSRPAVPTPPWGKQKQKVKSEQHDDIHVPSFSSKASTSSCVAVATAGASIATSAPSSSSLTYPALKPTSSASASNATNNVSNVAAAFASTALGNDNRVISFTTGEKRHLADEGETSSVTLAPTPSKKSKESDRFLPAFDFSSVFDEAMQVFEERLNSINTQI